mmetsp:Transcript_50358/g.113188  ORF Transcript_50358/g.113188 Transcript_50358/m.113188 type:complete len:353 (+) Transcript_50358:107-1165(+)|eukprot:CAMPEP_0197893488 /NCGR_PEP_ID=MMETSP1439-20131203/32782_1 /TAXON_ID=66791 /ORGANISM="Gonyaulax spinifera, Strain CCMP409" /LENGTH=352 /DNA_ID=CAMNT_0043513755 /DNA_START=101 /DNA_END=1159 /DNA_ORIENTATION=-
MIHYKRGGRWQFINLFHLTGSVFPASFAVAMPCAVMAGLLDHYDVIDEPCLTDETAWSGFTFLVGFLIIFRTRIAYKRFWAGCTAAFLMRAEWIDAASAIVAFCRYSVAPEEEITRFKHLVVRLFSALHLMALAEIEECENLDQVLAFALELIDPCGIDAKTWQILKSVDRKGTLVFTWLQTVIVENISTGVLSIPPPILSRIYQEMANGMVQLHEAQKITTVLFPFPYAQTCDALLVMHWMITPVVTTQWSANILVTVVFTFIQVFILWSLNNIAVEIEIPFGDDDNDLNAAAMQLDMNTNLLLLLHPNTTRAPSLSETAIIDGLWRASLFGTKAATFNEATLAAIDSEGQ